MNDKDAYELGLAELEKIKAFMDRPRCVNCEFFRDLEGVCGEIMEIVPESFRHTPNRCGSWMHKLPF